MREGLKLDYPKLNEESLFPSPTMGFHPPRNIYHTKISLRDAENTLG